MHASTPVSVNFWQRKTLVNFPSDTFGEQNFGTFLFVCFLYLCHETLLTFGESPVIHQIFQGFPPPKLCTIQYYESFLLKGTAYIVCVRNNRTLSYIERSIKDFHLDLHKHL